MTEKNKKKETKQQREIRLKKQRNKRKRQKRKKKLLHILKYVLIFLALLILGVFAWYFSKKLKKEPEKKEEPPVIQDTSTTEMLDLSKVLHLSFPTLIAVPETAFGLENTSMSELLAQQYLTVEEFQQILQQLYEKDYLLVSIRDLERAEEIQIPKGKKPLIISQQNVNYDLRLSNQGFASKLIIDESGKITNERIRLDGSKVTGNFDVVPCVEEFIEAHPDFSFQGAKGIIGLTGDQGILGYRTDASMGDSENNPYTASYGSYNTQEEIEKVQPVIQALKDAGWELACNGFDKVSYHTSLEQVQEDMRLWKERVEPLTGAVDILLFPMGNDLNNRKPYTEDDKIYSFLKESGFHYYCAADIESSWTVKTKQEIRCNYQYLDGYRMYCELYKDAGHFQDILDFQSLYNPLREKIGESGTEKKETTTSE